MLRRTSRALCASQSKALETFTFPIMKQEDTRPIMDVRLENSRRAWVQRALKLAVGAVGCFIAWDMNRRTWSVRHTWSSAFWQYAVGKCLGCLGSWRLQRLLADAENAETVQRQLLASLLARHQNTEYGRRRGLLGISGFEEFRKAHPITGPEDYEQDVASIFEGSGGVLTPQQPDFLTRTSGTSGPPHLIPHIAEISRDHFWRGVSVAFAVLDAEFPGAAIGLQRSAKLAFRVPRQAHANGVEVGSNAPSPDDFGFHQVLFPCASPEAAYRIESDQQALYAHTLLALKDRNLGVLEAKSVPLLCRLLETARETRRGLVQDLRNGHIWDRRLSEHVPDAALRDAIDAALGGPDPTRAAEVNKMLKNNAPATELWPHLRLVLAADGGVFSVEAARLRELLGEVEVYSPWYAVTEGLLGVNVLPAKPFGRSTYLLDPGSMVFELLPEEWRWTKNPPASATIFPWDAVVGHRYELVITTKAGLCRYRLGDVVHVHGMFGQMPLVSVEGRATNVLPSLRGERVPEGAFLDALASLPLSRRIRGAVVVEAPKSTPGSRYHIFVESASGASQADTSAEATALDAGICARDPVYASLRTKGSIRESQVHWVAGGTFAKLREALVAQDRLGVPHVCSVQVQLPTVVRGDLANLVVSAAVKPVHLTE